MNARDYTYVVYKNDGSIWSHYDLQETLDFYKFNKKDCCKIEAKTKELRPEIYTIIDKNNFNVERIRDDLSVKETTEARRKANKKYDDKHTKQFNLKLNCGTDADLIDYLEAHENKQGLIKELLREHIAKEKANYN